MKDKKMKTKDTVGIFATVSLVCCLLLAFLALKPSNTSQLDHLTRKVLSLEDLIIRNQRRHVDELTEVQKMVYSTVKKWIPEEVVENEIGSSFMTQMNRRQRVKKVCADFAFEPVVSGVPGELYRARSAHFSHKILKDSFLIAHLPPTVLCYNNKVASSTWMSTFAKLHGMDQYRRLNASGTFYKIVDVMSPSSSQQLVDTLSPGHYFTFTVVRHPFDRLISAYRDRILGGCTDQSKYHVPQILSRTRARLVRLGTSVLFDKYTGCIKTFPMFQEFIQYVVEKIDEHDPHWMSVNQHCSPCLVDYDAIIKLESSEEDEKYVLSQSRMDQFIQLEYRHYKPNHGLSANVLRAEYFSNVTCSQLLKLEAIYKMDLEMFDYTIEPFKQLCKQTPSDLI